MVALSTIDDDKEIRSVIAEVLSMSGYDVVEAASGRLDRAATRIRDAAPYERGREFALSPADLGFLTSTYLLAFAAFQLPLGVLLGSNERAYRSVEFLIDFFRSTPSSALIPLFLLIFGVSDINKVAIAAFGALLIVLLGGFLAIGALAATFFALAGRATVPRSQRRLYGILWVLVLLLGGPLWLVAAAGLGLL